MSLQDLRKTTDEIDIKIIKLLSERLKLARQIGQEKKESEKPIEDRHREAQVIKNVRDTG